MAANGAGDALDRDPEVALEDSEVGGTQGLANTGQGGLRGQAVPRVGADAVDRVEHRRSHVAESIDRNTLRAQMTTGLGNRLHDWVATVDRRRQLHQPEDRVNVCVQLLGHEILQGTHELLALVRLALELEESC